jgi:hypothetical protein
MQRILFVLLVGSLFIACKGSFNKGILVEDWLSEDQQTIFLNQLDSLRNSQNGAAITLDELVYFYDLPERGEQYFVLILPARSIQEKYVALGGMIQRDNNGNIQVYKETFRTWKHPKDVTLERSAFLFEQMVNGKDLTDYYSDKMGDTYIEFPNAHSFFDTDQRKWVGMHYPLEMKR